MLYIYAAKAGLLLRAPMFYFADCAIILYFACVCVYIPSPSCQFDILLPLCAPSWFFISSSLFAWEMYKIERRSTAASVIVTGKLLRISAAGSSSRGGKNKSIAANLT
jgi:hypothetical protein